MSSHQAAVHHHCRVLRVRGMRAVDESGKSRLCGVLKDKGLHEVIAVVPVEEVVQDRVDTTVDQRETLRQVQRHVQEVLQPTAEGKQVEQWQGVQQEDSVERQPAHQEDHDVGEDDSHADAALLIWAGRDRHHQEQVEDSDDGERDCKAKYDEAQLDTHHPLSRVIRRVHRPTDGAFVVRWLHRPQEVCVGGRGRQRQQPNQNADELSHHLLPAAVGGVSEQRDGQVAIHTHAGEEEDAAEEVDTEDQVSEFTDGLSKWPAPALQQRGHPHRQRCHDTQVSHSQVQDVQVRLIAVPVRAQVDPDHQSIGGKAHQEDKDIEDRQNVQQGGMADAAWTQQSLHVGQVVVVDGGQV